MRRQRHAKLLHALVDDAKADRRAAAHEPVADGHKIENFADDSGRKFLRGEHQLPVRVLAGKREQLVGARQQRVDRYFPQAVEFLGLEPDARRTGRAELSGDVGCTRHRERKNRDACGELLVRLLKLDVKFARAEHARGEAELEFAICDLPIVHPFAPHIRHDQARRGRELKRVDAGLLDIERQGMTDDQARFLHAGGDAIHQLQHRLHPTKLRVDAKRAGGKTVGGERPGQGVHLSQAGRGLNLHLRVVGTEGERTRFAFDSERLRRDQCSGLGRSFDGLLGIEREGVVLLDRLDEFHAQQRRVVGAWGDFPITNLFALQAGQRVRRG